MEEKTKKKSIFDNPLLSTKVKSANVKPKEALLGYLIGPLCALISNAIFGSYLNQYFNNVLGMTDYNSSFAVLMPMLSAIAVILGNLVVGRLIDRTRTKAGKARPFLLLAAPMLVIAIILLFTPPKDNSIWQLVWIAVAYNVYYAIAYPFFYTSHSSLVALSTRNTKHRGLLSTFSNASGVAAVGVGASILFPLFQGLLFVQEKGQPIDVDASYNAWRIFMIALCVITVVGILIEYFFTRERITEETKDSDANTKKPSMLQQLKATTSSKDWWIVIAYFLIFQLGGLIKNGSMGYYCYAMFGAADTAGAGVYTSMLGLVGGIPTAIGMVIAWPIAAKLGKRNSMIIGLIISVAGGAVSFIDVNNFYIVCTGVVLKGVGSIPAMYVSLALLSDVLDHLEAKNKFRSDGFTMSIYGSIMVGLTGISTGVVNGLLGAGGYDFKNVVVQSDSAKTAVVWCYLGIELLCYAALVLLLFFTNVEKGIKQDQLTIIEHQKQETLAAGREWIEPAERLRMEQEESDKAAEDARLAEERAYCEKKGLNFEEYEAKYQEKKALSAAKKAAFFAKFKKKKPVDSEGEPNSELSVGEGESVEPNAVKDAESVLGDQTTDDTLASPSVDSNADKSKSADNPDAD